MSRKLSNRELTRGLGKILDLPLQPPPTPIQQRLIEAAAGQNDEERSLLYQHTVLCQTSLPLSSRVDRRTWESRNGNVFLLVEAGRALDPTGQRWMELALPGGRMPRLLLLCFNREAKLRKEPLIEIGNSVTDFTRRVLDLNFNGKNILKVKEQLARLSAARMLIGVPYSGGAKTFKTDVVKGFDLWFPKDERQRVLWPSTVQLSQEYFASLMEHAVPLDEAHIRALAHSALALDIYAWLAQRLHRLEKMQLVSWLELWRQFGQSYDPNRLDKFRQVFRVALKQVLTVYRDARVVDEEARQPRLTVLGDGSTPGSQVWRSGPAKPLKLYPSPPPVKPRAHILLP